MRSRICNRPSLPSRMCVELLFAALLFCVQSARVAIAQSDPRGLQDRAIARVNEYLDNFRRTGDKSTLLPALSQARDDLSLSCARFVASRENAAAALSLLTLGDIERFQDHWHAALGFYERAHTLAAAAKHGGRQVRALVGVARVKAFGEQSLSEADDYLKEAIRLASDDDKKEYLFEALEFAGQVEVLRGNISAAGAYLDRALGMPEGSVDRTTRFYAQSDRGDAYLKRAEKCDYDRDFEPCYEAVRLSRSDYQSALSTANALGFAFLAKQTRTILGLVDAREALIKSIEGAYNRDMADIFHPKRALDVLVTQAFRPGVDSSLAVEIDALVRASPEILNSPGPRSAFIAGTVYQLRGSNDSALTAFLRAIDMLEHDRTRLRDELNRGTFLEDKIDFYYAPVLELLEKRRIADAFRLLEQSRSRAMSDLLASRALSFGSPTERSLYAASMKKRAEIAQMQKSLFEQVATSAKQPAPDSIAALERRINAGELELRRVESTIQRESPKLAALMVSEPVTLDSVQKAAAAGAYDVLYYLVLDHALIVWHIDGSGAQVWNVFLPRSQLIKSVALLRSNLTERRQDDKSTFNTQLSQELFLFLIQPALSSLRTNHLVIIPHDDLNELPFQVLQDPTDGRYLGERFRLSYAPSASILATLQPPKNLALGRLLAVADPAMADGVAEVKAIGNLYEGRSKVVTNSFSTKNDVEVWIRDYNLIHLSVHGRFEAEDPLLSHLDFRPSSHDNGRLTAAEMFGLPLAPNAFIVLSACETGRVRATHSNETLGMVRGLLFAGASGLVMSFWEVQSQATSLWMQTFYQEAQMYAPSEAARLALIAVKARPEYQHPYFWAAFAMIGK